MFFGKPIRYIYFQNQNFIKDKYLHEVEILYLDSAINTDSENIHIK
jgi:hypothetical protein